MNGRDSENVLHSSASFARTTLELCAATSRLRKLALCDVTKGLREAFSRLTLPLFDILPLGLSGGSLLLAEVSVISGAVAAPRQRRRPGSVQRNRDTQTHTHTHT